MNDAHNDTLPRWIMAVMIILLFSLLVGGIWYFNSQKTHYHQMAVNELSAIARLKIDQIVDWRTDQIEDASLLVRNPLFTENATRFLLNPDPVLAENLTALLLFFQKTNDIADIFLVDTEGLVRLSLSGKAERHSGYMPYLKTALHDGKPVLTDVHAALPDLPHISVIAPIAEDDGHAAVGAVVLVSDTARVLVPMTRSWPTPTLSAETLLVTRDGDDVLFLNDLRHKPDAACRFRIPLSRTEVPAVMAVTGQNGFVEGQDYRGIDVLAVIMPVPDSHWFMVAKVDSLEIFNRWRSHGMLILTVIVALVGGLIGFGMLVLQRNRKIHYQKMYQTETELRVSMEKQAITLDAIGDAVIATDGMGRVERLNPVAEALTGWSFAEAIGRPLDDVFCIIDEETRQPAQNPVQRVLREGRIVGLTNHTLLIARDGREIPIADSAAPIRDIQSGQGHEPGSICGVVLVFHDQSTERRTSRLIQTRLMLLSYAQTHTLDELLTKALDEVGLLVNSPIGFYHCVNTDQSMPTPQIGSTRIRNGFCETGDARNSHDSIDQTGIWADCVREKKPVVHNPPASLPHKNEMPQDHARLVRELAVPVIREGRVTAILGTGNKPVDYTETDVEAVSYLADVIWQIIEQKQTLEELRKREEQMQSIFRAAPVGIGLVKNRVLLDVNSRICEMTGYEKEALIGRNARMLYPTQDEFTFVGAEKYRQISKKGTGTVETRWLKKDGTIIDVLLSSTPLDISDLSAGVTFTALDITERRKNESEREKLQGQLMQARKMESVGRLAGGIAHDFNNKLQAIMGYIHLALQDAGPGGRIRHSLTEIEKAAQGSTELVRQLLGFARKQAINPIMLDLNETLTGMLNMLRRLIGENIHLVWKPGANLWPVRMDPTQIDQILVNLAVNARDAISGIGNLVVETENRLVDETGCSNHAGFVPGAYVLLTVRDTGCGMSQEILDNIFEPFFTTKEIGKGTGLGLATIYGIVKQNKGYIHVNSEPGAGTTFQIYLPRIAVETAVPETVNNPETLTGGTETILLVEDDDMILELTETILGQLGYTVLSALTPGRAIDLAMQHHEPINLMITDVVMPDMNGKELRERLNTVKPGIQCIFISGYNADIIANNGILDDTVHFLQKPFSVQSLAEKVRLALENNDSKDEK